MKKLFYLSMFLMALAGSAVSQPAAYSDNIGGEIIAAQKPAAKSFFSEIRLTGAGDDENSFVLRGDSETFSIILTVFLDHDGAANIIERNTLAKGMWVMIVNRAGDYVGTLFGDLDGGKVRQTQDVLTGVKMGRVTSAGLRILGGRDAYNGVEANDVPTLRFSSFTKFLDNMRDYTEARLVKGMDLQPE